MCEYDSVPWDVVGVLDRNGVGTYGFGDLRIRGVGGPA